MRLSRLLVTAGLLAAIALPAGAQAIRINGADFTIDTADNLSRGVYINGAGSHLVFNKALSLSGDITIGGSGTLDAYGDVSANTAGAF